MMIERKKSMLKLIGEGMLLQFSGTNLSSNRKNFSFFSDLDPYFKQLS